jgi:hypothetical protein
MLYTSLCFHTPRPIESARAASVLGIVMAELLSLWRRPCRDPTTGGPSSTDWSNGLALVRQHWLELSRVDGG